MMAFLGEVGLAGGSGGGYLGEVSIAGGIGPGTITGLNPQELLFGSATGSIEQSPAMVFDPLTLPDPTLSLTCRLIQDGQWSMNSPGGAACALSANGQITIGNMGAGNMGLSTQQIMTLQASKSVQITGDLANGIAALLKASANSGEVALQAGADISFRSLTQRYARFTNTGDLIHDVAAFHRLVNFGGNPGNAANTVTEYADNKAAFGRTQKYYRDSGNVEYYVGSPSPFGALLASNDPPPTNYPNGTTIINTIVAASATPGARAILPNRWTIPAKPAASTTTPQIVFVFSDGGVVTRTNALAAPLTEDAGSLFWGKNGPHIRSIRFEVDNSGPASLQNIGEFKIEGWVF